MMDRKDLVVFFCAHKHFKSYKLEIINKARDGRDLSKF